MPSEFKVALLENMTGGYCAYCGKWIADEMWHMDHIIPRSKGGGWKYNLIPACEQCNLSKGCSMPEEFREWLTTKTYKVVRAIWPRVVEFCKFLNEDEAEQIIDGLTTLLNDIAEAEVEFFVEDLEEVSRGSWPNVKLIS